MKGEELVNVKSTKVTTALCPGWISLNLPESLALRLFTSGPQKFLKSLHQDEDVVKFTLTGAFPKFTMIKPTLTQLKLKYTKSHSWKGILRYHDLFLSARSDVSFIVVLSLLAPLLDLIFLVLLQTGLQLSVLLIHRGATQTLLFTDAAVGHAVVVLTHG